MLYSAVHRLHTTQNTAQYPPPSRPPPHCCATLATTLAASTACTRRASSSAPPPARWAAARPSGSWSSGPWSPACRAARPCGTQGTRTSAARSVSACGCMRASLCVCVGVAAAGQGRQQGGGGSGVRLLRLTHIDPDGPTSQQGYIVMYTWSQAVTQCRACLPPTGCPQQQPGQCSKPGLPQMPLLPPLRSAPLRPPPAPRPTHLMSASLVGLSQMGGA